MLKNFLITLLLCNALFVPLSMNAKASYSLRGAAVGTSLGFALSSVGSYYVRRSSYCLGGALIGLSAASVVGGNTYSNFMPMKERYKGAVCIGAVGFVLGSLFSAFTRKKVKNKIEIKENERLKENKAFYKDLFSAVCGAGIVAVSLYF